MLSRVCCPTEYSAMPTAALAASSTLSRACGSERWVRCEHSQLRARARRAREPCCAWPMLSWPGATEGRRDAMRTAAGAVVRAGGASNLHRLYRQTRMGCCRLHQSSTNRKTALSLSAAEARWRLQPAVQAEPGRVAGSRSARAAAASPEHVGQVLVRQHGHREAHAAQGAPLHHLGACVSAQQRWCNEGGEAGAYQPATLPLTGCVFSCGKRAASWRGGRRRWHD
jgi:hypothetical protein